MSSIARIYPSEQQAMEAARGLEQEGFGAFTMVLTPSEVAGREAAAVQLAVERERLPGSQAKVCAASLQQGRSLVAVSAPFGCGQQVTRILDDAGPVDTERLPPPSRRNPAPFSDFLGIPVLSEQRPRTDLSIVSYSLGEPRLSRNPAPLSSRVGLKTLVRYRRRNSSLGLPLLSRNPTPLSSLLRLKTLSGFRRDRTSSFGLPLLSRNPAPLSSLFGLRVLSGKKRKRD